MPTPPTSHGRRVGRLDKPDLLRRIPARTVTRQHRRDATRYVASRAAQASTHELWVHAPPGKPGIRVATRAQVLGEWLDILGLDPAEVRGA